MAVNSIAFLNMIESRMARPFMCLLMSEAIEAIVKVKRKNDCNFFKDCAMAMWIVMAFYFPFIHWLVLQRLRDYLWHKSGDWNSLFTHCLRRHEKKELRDWRNSLIFSVDQPGLEPGTSRLWVCCSNQLSYKSGVSLYRISGAKVVFSLEICKRFR